MPAMPLEAAEYTEIGTIRAGDLNRFIQASPQLKQFMNSVEYDLVTGTYSRNGVTISDQELLGLIAIERERLTRKFEDASTLYLDGRIDLEEWENRIADESKTVAVIVALFMFGGAAMLRRNPEAPKIWSEVGQFLRAQLDGVRGFAGNIADRSPKQIMAYVRYKSRLIRPLFSTLRKKSAESLGFNEGRRFLDPTADHCPSCPAHQRTEWVPISEITPVGVDCECMGRCRCRVEFRRNLNLTLSQQIARMG